MMRIFVLWIFLFVGCAPNITETDFFREHPEDTNLEDTVLELAVIRDGNLTITLTAPDSLHVGTSRVWLEASMNGTPLSTGRFSFLPRWISETHMILSPLGAVSLLPMDKAGHFEGTPTFIPPNGEEGEWQLEVTYSVGGKSGSAIVPVRIQPSIWVQYTDEYYVSWIQPARLVTGLHEIEFALHYFADHRFQPLEDATIDLYPWMNMGAGQGHSTPFEAPVHVQDGRYKGSVNFIMSGGWDMTLFIEHSDGAQDTVTFNGFTVH